MGSAMEKKQADLLLEFEKSGMGLDSFMKMKLEQAGKSDADRIVGEIDATARSIDENYADLKRVKVDDESRRSWLKRRLEPVFAGITPRQAGAVMGHLTAQLAGSGEEVPEDAVYNEFNADGKIEDLDTAIQISVCRDFLGDEGKEE
ncbi:MAG: hypothetical protein IJU70_09110 [Lentisphaeria bacterium]|nr:hypothetical protein [Lentisphaeria bacterium]